MPQAPDWPKVLSLTVHEFRTPLTVVAGYLRMLSTDRVGPLSDAQKRVIEEAEKSCGRLSSLLTEVSDVAHFHQGRQVFLRGPIDLARVLAELELPASGDSPMTLVRGDVPEGTTLTGDATRLRQALVAIAAAVARETLDGEALHVVPHARAGSDGRELLLAVGSEQVARAVAGAAAGSLSEFDTTRGGSGLSLVVARQVIEEHGGRIFGAPGDRVRAGAGITLPLSS